MIAKGYTLHLQEGELSPLAPQSYRLSAKERKALSITSSWFKYKREIENMEKSKAWDFALGIIKVDNLKVSEEFLELVEKEKKGEITNKNIKNFLDEKYIKLGGKK